MEPSNVNHFKKFRSFPYAAVEKNNTYVPHFPYKACLFHTSVIISSKHYLLKYAQNLPDDFSTEYLSIHCEMVTRYENQSYFNKSL